jgi:5'(3')-deoxyribonucleotidase
MSIIYLDMDGVIADFFGGLEDYYNVQHWKELDIEESITNLRNTSFFYDLLPFVTAGKLIEKVHDEVGSLGYGICSSPLRGDFANSSYWKRRWLESHLWMPEVRNCIFTGQKERYATNTYDGSPNILIDDKPTNIARWNQAGGIGIRYQANEDDLEDYLFPKMEEALDFIRSSRFKV